MRLVALAAGVVFAVAGCSPTEPVEPSGGASVVPSAVVSATEDSAPSQSPSEPVQRITVEPIPLEAYPAEVDGHSFESVFGLPTYNIVGTSSADSERITMLDTGLITPPGEMLILDRIDDDREVLPGIFCYVTTSTGLDLCLGADASGRVWEGTQMFGSKSQEDLAAWLQKFLDVV